MRRLPTLLWVLASVMVASLGSMTARVDAYSTYNPSTASNGCFQCHPGFENRNALHDMHVGSAQMTNTCGLCHQSTGDNPNIGQSADGGSCTGCHVAEGLRLHHKNAAAPVDAEGRTCATCHTEDGTPATENVNPPYYARTDVLVKDPCIVASSNGGEDWNGDSTGLDNDGDLLYDANDSDCATAVRDVTWGAIKGLYVR